MVNRKYTFLFFLYTLFVCTIFIGCKKEAEVDDIPKDPEPPLELDIEVAKVWGNEGYNSSSDIVWYKDAFYCAFRESVDDGSSGGSIRVIKSVDGVAWEEVSVLEFRDFPPPADYPDHLEFNGSNQYAKIAHHSDFDFTKNDVFSLSAWVYREVGSPAGALVSTRSANNQNAFDFDAQNNVLMIDFGNPHFRRHNVSSVHPFTFGEWHHVGYSYDGPNQKIMLFIDGVSVDLNTGTNNLLGTEWNDYGNDISIFAKATNKTSSSQVPTARFSKGKIRTLRFWKKVMTEADMIEDMEANVDAETPDLIAGYDFGLINLEERDNNWVVPDVKGNHDGILYNFAIEKTTSEFKGDLQKPKLSVGPGNRLMLIMLGGYDNEDGSYGHRRQYVSYSDNGETFSPMIRSEIFHSSGEILDDEGFFIPGVTWDQTTLNAYGFANAAPFTLFKTSNGTKFNTVFASPDVSVVPGDSEIRFDKRNRLYALVRNIADAPKDILAVSSPPYVRFEFHDLNFNLPNPNFALLENQTLAMAALGNQDNQTLNIIVTGLTGNVLHEVPVPLEGLPGTPKDVSVIVHDKYLWASYTMHYNDRSDIYIAKIPLQDLL